MGFARFTGSVNIKKELLYYFAYNNTLKKVSYNKLKNV